MSLGVEVKVSERDDRACYRLALDDTGLIEWNGEVAWTLAHVGNGYREDLSGVPRDLVRQGFGTEKVEVSLLCRPRRERGMRVAELLTLCDIVGFGDSGKVVFRHGGNDAVDISGGLGLVRTALEERLGMASEGEDGKGFFLLFSPRREEGLMHASVEGGSVIWVEDTMSECG